MTPIVLSFEQAAKDFPDKNARNIVCVTDDEELAAIRGCMPGCGRTGSS